MKDNMKIAEQVAEKFSRLDAEGKEFVLGYLTGKHDEKTAKAGT